MTNMGRSKRSRANRRRMSQEYLEHWEDRLPRAEKPESYKKLGLPLVLLPFVLMFCGGCVATVPTASFLITALAGLMWFGDVVIKEAKAESYWVVYRKQPTWLVEETKEAAEIRRTATLSVAEERAVRYPDDYAGRVQSVVPIAEQRPPWAIDHLDCVNLPLTRTQLSGCRTRKLKIVDGVLQTTAFVDTYGTIADILLKTHTEAEVAAAIDGDDAISRDLQNEIYSLVKALPQTITHTGTGLYAVKVTPTNESETQSGAVAGQVVTIVGTVAASPAFTGGYITNSTQAETRAIVSHDTTTATLEGDISGWDDGDTLEWYDAWSTVDAAADQVYTDQGATDYTIPQIVEIYDGTYTEAVAWTAMAPTQQNQLIFRAASGETAVIVDGDGDDAFIGTSTPNTQYNGFDIRSGGYGTQGVYHYAEGIRVIDCVFPTSGVDQSNGVSTNNPGYVEGCEFNNIGIGIGGVQSTVKNCTFISCDTCLNQVVASDSWYFMGNYVDDCDVVVRINGSSETPGATYTSCYLVNNTIYSATEVIIMSGSQYSRGLTFTAYNNIFHTCVTVWDADTADGGLAFVRADYNTYYNCTQVAEIDGSNHALAAWQGLSDSRGDSPDANSVTTDPGLTNPGTGDLSLTAASNCRHAGIGSFALVQEGANGVAFDKWHPDKGAWSSGAGPNIAHSG